MVLAIRVVNMQVWVLFKSCGRPVLRNKILAPIPQFARLLDNFDPYTYC